MKVYRVDLGSDEIEKHLETGRQITCLSLVLHDSVAFDIDERLIVRKFQLLDGANDRLESTERQTLQQASAFFRAHRVFGFNTYGEHFQGVHLNQTFTGVVIAQPAEG